MKPELKQAKGKRTLKPTNSTNLHYSGAGEIKIPQTGMNVSTLRKHLKAIQFPDRSGYYGELYGPNEPIRRA